MLGAHTIHTFKGCIICMRVFNNEPFHEIERKTGVKSSDAQRIRESAHERAGSDDFPPILTSIEPKHVFKGLKFVVDWIGKSAVICTLVI